VTYTCQCNSVIVSAADRDDVLRDIHSLWTEVINVCIHVTAQLAVVHFPTCKQLTFLYTITNDNYTAAQISLVRSRHIKISKNCSVYP